MANWCDRKHSQISHFAAIFVNVFYLNFLINAHLYDISVTNTNALSLMDFIWGTRQCFCHTNIPSYGMHKCMFA